ncbi:hypothetical protein N0V94_002522 [Neodidymelliopsis sp. IMI 364377]|nr:hypothetical protein N0V94_002522 [Neodidymelliopsis sp. IMI 364377]
MSAIIRTAQDIAGNVGAKIQHTTNSALPPKQREQALEHLRTFALRNPKLASFLAAQLAFAGLPVLLFVTFAVSTLVVSLITCLLLGLIAALIFTLFTTGFALLFVLPIVFIGSCTASTTFVWGFVGYLVLKRINGGETPVKSGTKVGDTMNKLTGGRLRSLVDDANADTKQERLALDSSPNKEIAFGRDHGHTEHKTRIGSPHRRHHGQANGSGYSGEVGQENSANGTRSTEAGMRDHPEIMTTGHGPAVVRIVDWKTEFQQEA